MDSFILVLTRSCSPLGCVVKPVVSLTERRTDYICGSTAICVDLGAPLRDLNFRGPTILFGTLFNFFPKMFRMTLICIYYFFNITQFFIMHVKNLSEPCFAQHKLISLWPQLLLLKNLILRGN